MWVEVVCGLVLYRAVKTLFFPTSRADDAPSSNALFDVAERLQKVYDGCKVYVGLRIPDRDSASPQNIDILLLTHREAFVISVKNDISGSVLIDKEGDWIVRTDSHRTRRLPDPVAETKQVTSVLEDYLEQRGLVLPQGYFSPKVVCANPSFCTESLSFPPEVITYDQWTQLKSGGKKFFSGWIRGALLGGKKREQELFMGKLNSVLSTAPRWDRLELKGNKYILGEFLEFKGKQDDLHSLRKIKRSKVSDMTFQKMSMFNYGRIQLLYVPRDYRVTVSSWYSRLEEVRLSSSTEIVFQPKNSKNLFKYALSSVISMSLSA